MTISATIQTVEPKGNLVYEYNPLHNYRYETDVYEYYTLNQNQNGYNKSSVPLQDYTDVNNIDEALQQTSKPSNIRIIQHAEGELQDFTSDKLDFDLNHPVDLLPSYTYDGTVNLILNDDKNYPKLINTRFTDLGNNQYEVIDRKGNADTNIYDNGFEFDIDTSLYKKVNTIPRLFFNGTFQGGNLSVGNYHFYFKYTDGDGNDTDFVAESGLVSIFIGESPNNIQSGIEVNNECRDLLFNRQFPNSKPDTIDKFNNFVTDSLYFADNFTRYPVGHFAALYGRDVRDNYQFNYQRSPFPDKFERSWDAFKKATEFDY